MTQKTSNKVTSGIPPRHPDRTNKPISTTQSASKEMTGKKPTPHLKQTQAAQKGFQATPPTMTAQHVPEGQPPKSVARHPDSATPALKNTPAAQKDRLRSAIDTGRPKASADDKRATGQSQTGPKAPNNKVSGIKPTKAILKRESGRAGSSERKGSRVSGKEKKTSRLGGPKPQKPPPKGNKSNGLSSTPGKHGGNSSHITNNSSVTNSTTNTTIHIIGGNSDNSEAERNTTSDDLSGDETDGSGDFPEAIGLVQPGNILRDNQSRKVSPTTMESLINSLRLRLIHHLQHLRLVVKYQISLVSKPRSRSMVMGFSRRPA
ncbi:hypothetical protein COL26b_014102 [Colletotrichum chrysophilum]|uniref:uncharacterized protein n=1 Tax=Colletotrichum chrysophilum TaxID=1836956 RepID=UPI0023007544|nr:uncharacterized protein COL26b_014102 [Colletotrichum chrysophilum]KAJ0360384.1 hypothetical protein COL26b_014102 [Colletotrichum chrysophilum]